MWDPEPFLESNVPQGTAPLPVPPSLIGYSRTSFQEVLGITLPLNCILCPAMCIDSPRGSPEPPVCLSPRSSPDKEAGGPSRLLRQPENEPVPFPPSQVSLLGSLACVHRMLPPFSWSACLFILKANGR